MYRPPGQTSASGCPAITTGATCEPSAWTTAPPTSCDAIATSCQTFHDVSMHGDPTTITKQRSYDPKVRGFWTAQNNYPVGQAYWLDKFGSLGYQSEDSTVPLLVGYYVVPVVQGNENVAIVLIQVIHMAPTRARASARAFASFSRVNSHTAKPLNPCEPLQHQIWYDAIAAALAAFGHIGYSVVYIMEAATGELVASSNGEAIFTSTGSQKMATAATTELISASASYMAGFFKTASGSYQVSTAMTMNVMDYYRGTKRV